MFNTEQHQDRIAAMMELIEHDDDKFWLRTVNQRYGIFLAGQSERAIALAMRNLSLIADDAIDQKHRDHFASEFMGACSMLHAAAALIRGSVIVPDPMTCEAQMRLYKLDNTPAVSGEA